MIRRLCLSLFAFAAVSGAARADITVGISLALTGPTASLGIPYKNAFDLLPKTLGGEPAKYIILDDESKPDNAAKNARKYVTEDKVDVLMGSAGVPSTMAMIQVAAESKTPMITLTPVAPMPPERAHWTFVVPQTTELMMSAVVDHMKAHGVKTVGFIGFSDSWGDLVYNAMMTLTKDGAIKVVTNERYARPDTSVTGQVLKVMAANPDAVVVGGSGSPGATPHIALRERGYKGLIYHTHGTVNRAFIDAGKKNVEGAIAPTGALIVPEELPANFPTKAVSSEFTQKYEAKFGAGSRNGFSGYSYDAVKLLDSAAPAALKKAKPGTPEFREAMRASLETLKNVIGTHGVYNMSPTDHNGLDERARVLVKVENGAWRLMK